LTAVNAHKPKMTPEIKFPELTIRLPAWVERHLKNAPDTFPDMEKKMHFVIDLSYQNVEHNTGGPFAAAVFDEKGRLVAPGVNTVMTSNCSVLHAEIMAIALAQKTLGRYDISDNGNLRYDLFATTEPCAMCFGAVPWSGVRRLVCGARSEDAQKIGFDEGPRLYDWVEALNDRGIDVVRDVLREEAAAVLKAYSAAGGLIYNPGRKKKDST
jgi:tRNA(Arg) A34 adenosine deaminase TadA